MGCPARVMPAEPPVLTACEAHSHFVQRSAASSHGALPPLALNPPPQLLTLTCAQPPAARICAELGTTRHWQVCVCVCLANTHK